MKRLKIKLLKSFIFLIAIVPIIMRGQTKVTREDLKSLGPENTAIAQRIGTWYVTETTWLMVHPQSG